MSRFKSRGERWFTFMTNLTWTNMPAALTEFGGNTYGRFKLNLAGVSQVQVHVNIAVVGAASAEVRLQYSTDNGANWSYLDGGTTPRITIGTLGFKSSGWVNIVAGARREVLLRLVGINGDGAADPYFSVLHLRFR